MFTHVHTGIQTHVRVDIYILRYLYAPFFAGVPFSQLLDYSVNYCVRTIPFAKVYLPACLDY